MTYYKLMVFVLAAFFAGMAGVLYGHTLANIKPAMFDYNMSIEILVIVVLGGMGSIRGSSHRHHHPAGSAGGTASGGRLPDAGLLRTADRHYAAELLPAVCGVEGRWSLKALLSLGKTRKEKTKKEAAKK